MLNHARLSSFGDKEIFLTWMRSTDPAIFYDLLCGALSPDYFFIVVGIPENSQDTVISPVLSGRSRLSDAVQVFGHGVGSHIFRVHHAENGTNYLRFIILL